MNDHDKLIDLRVELSTMADWAEGKLCFEYEFDRQRIVEHLIDRLRHLSGWRDGETGS